MALENVPLDELYYDESILSDGDGNEINFNKKVRKTKQKSMKKKKLSPVANILEDDVDVFSDEGDDEDFDVDEENTDDDVKEEDYADDGKLKPRKKQKQDRKQSSAVLKPVSSGKMADSDKKKANKKKKKNVSVITLLVLESCTYLTRRCFITRRINQFWRKMKPFLFPSCFRSRQQLKRKTSRNP